MVLALFWPRFAEIFGPKSARSHDGGVQPADQQQRVGLEGPGEDRRGPLGGHGWPITHSNHGLSSGYSIQVALTLIFRCPFPCFFNAWSIFTCS